jgi:hypothetical protein
MDPNLYIPEYQPDRHPKRVFYSPISLYPLVCRACPISNRQIVFILSRNRCEVDTSQSGATNDLALPGASGPVVLHVARSVQNLIHRPVDIWIRGGQLQENKLVSIISAVLPMTSTFP